MNQSNYIFQDTAQNRIRFSEACKFYCGDYYLVIGETYILVKYHHYTPIITDISLIKFIGIEINNEYKGLDFLDILGNYTTVITAIYVVAEDFAWKIFNRTLTRVPDSKWIKLEELEGKAPYEHEAIEKALSQLKDKVVIVKGSKNQILNVAKLIDRDAEHLFVKSVKYYQRKKKVWKAISTAIILVLTISLLIRACVNDSGDI